MKEIGFLCSDLSEWISLRRTKKFYIDALSNTHQVTIITNDQDWNESHQEFDLFINFFGNLAWKFKDVINVPVLFCLHGGAVLDYEFLIKNASKLTLSDSFIVNCSSDLKVLNQLFKKPPRSYLLKLPVNGSIKNFSTRVENKAVLNISDKTLVIGYIARILPQKNLHHTIELVHKIKQQLYKDVTLIIVGNYWVDYPVLNWEKNKTYYYDYINSLIESYGLKENVMYFESNLSDEELSLCYGCLDFLHHPTNSLDENFGYAPVEAMQCGTPTIATAYGGLKDSITHNETGYLLDTWCTDSGIRFDYKSALDYIQMALENNSVQRTLSKNCYKRARELYSTEYCSKNLLEIVADNFDKSVSFQKHAGDPTFLEYTTYNFLPKSKPSWSYYKKVVELYCSVPVEDIAISETTYLCKFGNTVIKNMTIESNDPTWPFKITLDAVSKEIITHCNKPIMYKNLAQVLSFDLNPKQIMHLIKLGVLIFFNSDYEKN